MAQTPSDGDLLQLLCCPGCHAPLTPQNGGLACAACALLYPEQDGVLNFLEADARPLDPADLPAPDPAAR